MLARTHSIGCAPPTPFLTYHSRTLKAAGEVFPRKQLILRFPSRPSRPGNGRLAAASETQTDVEVPDVTSAIEESIQRAVERASAPVDPPPSSPPPESIPTFKETAPAAPSPTAVDVSPLPKENPVQTPSVPESVQTPSVPAPVQTPPVPEPVQTPSVPEPIQSTTENIVMKTPEVPKPVEFSPAPDVSPVDPPASPPELPSTPPAPKLPEGVPTGDVKAAAGQAITGVKKAAGQTLTGVQDAAGQTVSGIKKAAGQTVTGVQDAAKKAADQAASGVKQAAGQAASGVKQAADQAASGVQGTADKAVTGAKQAASKSLDTVIGAASDKAGEVKNVGTDAGRKLQGVLSNSTDSIAAGYKNAINGVGNSIEAGKQAVQANVITPVKSTAASAVDQVVGSIPPEVKATVGATVRPVVNHPVASLLAISTFAGIYAAVTIKNRFSYRPPTITPFEALGLLEASEEPALLVDLRSEEERFEMGIPRLRKKAFGKGTAVEAYRLPAKLATRVRNQTQAEAAITAAYIGGQEKASVLTKFILMGSQSEDYKSIVDALRASGFSQVAVLDGGFSSWVSAGLPVNTSPVATYEAGTLDAITEFAQVVADGLPPVDGPYAYFQLSVGVVAAAWAVFNYAFVLQMIGVIGPLVSGSVILINDYDSPGDFFKEMSQFAKNSTQSSATVEVAHEEKETTKKSVNGDPGAA